MPADRFDAPEPPARSWAALRGDDEPEAVGTVRIAIPADGNGERMIESAVELVDLPNGSLDGWTIVDVRADVWSQMVATREELDRAKTSFEKAARANAEAVDAVADNLDG